uniref:Preprotein-translocase subunit g n=1 Tax=Platysiphonia delicata TaxID=2006979 RepID=A0A1Z1M0I6_9FLOR|nr:preprotein-translocase subunit g [Platysiphonia delicata]ARW59607.1 preprotein-translocase subunit g [Platysiphonia delicata]
MKLLWYFVVMVNILLILFNSPNGNNGYLIGSQSKFFNLSSNQILVQKIIFVIILIFIIVTTICSI